MVNSCQFLILKKNCVGWFNPHWWHFPMSSVGQKLQPSHRHGRVGHLAARGIFLASLRIGSQAMTLLKPNPGMDGMDAMVSMCCFWRSIGLFKRMFLLVEMTNDPKTMVEADKNLRKLPEVNWDFSPFFWGAKCELYRKTTTQLHLRFRLCNVAVSENIRVNWRSSYQVSGWRIKTI